LTPDAATHLAAGRDGRDPARRRASRTGKRGPVPSQANGEGASAMDPASRPCGPSADCNPKIKVIFEYWTRISPPGALPGRQHFDPLDLKALLPNLWIVDVVGDPPRFKYRIAGTKIVDYLGQEPTGKWMDEVFPHLEESYTFRDLMTTVREGRPQWRRGTPTLQIEKSFKVVEQLSLPLASDGKKVDMVMNLTVF